MTNLLSSIILGVVEGITEFLPISSTGHLLLAEHFLKCTQSDAFNIVVQIGPILAVVVIFWKRIIELLTGWKDPVLRDELVKLAACFFLTGVGGLVAKKLGLKLPETLMPIALATLIGALVIFYAEAKTKGKSLSDSITWPVVFAVAAGQLLAAVFPGTSRSGAAVIAALLLGVSRPAAVRFAFLVGIPTLLAAGALEVMGAIKMGEGSSLLEPSALAAFAAATLTAWLAVKWLLRYIQTSTFVPFAWYRIALGLIIIYAAYL